MGDVLSILLDLGKWPNSFPAKGEGGLRLGWALEALIGVGVGKTDRFVDWGNGEGAQEERFVRIRSPNSNNHTNMWLLSLGLCGRLPQLGRQCYLVTLGFHLWLSLPGVPQWILFSFPDLFKLLTPTPLPHSQHRDNNHQLETPLVSHHQPPDFLQEHSPLATPLSHYPPPSAPGFLLPLGILLLPASSETSCNWLSIFFFYLKSLLSAGSFPSAFNDVQDSLVV